MRDVDYCSGACIMIPKDLWDELGGFDKTFSPAYYEDTDLAFRVRQAGYRVLYQPMSQITHFEGASSGTDISTGIKHNQAINQQKFLEKWQDALKNYGNSEKFKEIRYQDKWSNYRVLFIDGRTPTPDKDSGSIDAIRYMQILRALGFSVTFIPDNLAYCDSYTKMLQASGIEALYSPYITSIPQFLTERVDSYELVILSRFPVAQKYIDIVRQHNSNARIIFNTVDLHFLRKEREAALKGDEELLLEAKEDMDQEIQVMEKSHQTIMVSRHEIELLSTIAPAVNVSLISPPRDIPGRNAPFDERKDILFIGGFQHMPNIDAVNYFVSEIWPLVLEKLPDANFLIVGSDMPSSFEGLAQQNRNVILKGFVADLAEVLDHCRLTVAPLRYGAGIKGKIVTSLSYGVPCVATSLAIEGMGLAPGRDILSANSPEEFARRIAEMYSSPNLWNKLSDNGLEAVRSIYSIGTIQAEWAKLLQTLGFQVKDEVENHNSEIIKKKKHGPQLSNI